MRGAWNLMVAQAGRCVTAGAAALIAVLAAGPTHAGAASDEPVIDSPGAEWTPVPDIVDPVPGAESGGWYRDDFTLQISAYPPDTCTTTGLDNRAQALVAAWSLGLPRLRSDAGVDYFGVDTPMRIRVAVFQGRDHSFAITLFGLESTAAEVDEALAELVQQQASDEQPLTIPDERPPSRLDSLVMPTSLDGATAALPIDLDQFVCEDLSNEVLEFLSRHTTDRTSLYSLAPFVAVTLTDYPYDEFAAATAGIESSDIGARIELDGLDRLPGASAWTYAATPGQVLVRFRQGQIVVESWAWAPSQADAESLALDYAVAQQAVLPAGDTDPLHFPSTVRSLLTATIAVGLFGVGILAVRKWRGGRGVSSPSAPSTEAVVADVVAVDSVATRLRRLGWTIAVLQVVAVTVMFVAVTADVGAWRWGLALGALLGGFVITLVGRRVEWRSAHQDHLRVQARRSVAAAALSVGAATVTLAGGACAVLGLRELVLAPSLSHLQRADRLGIAPRLLATLLVVVGVVVLAAGALAFRFARALDRVGWKRDEGRPPVLYLRSFDDDQLEIPSVLSARRPFVEFFTLRGREAFEESVAWELSNVGPVIAVGRPGTSRATLGAAREHVGEDWHPAVQERMAAAALIVVAIGSSGGLEWELEQAVTAGHLGKVRFVVPPVSQADVDARWSSTVEVLTATTPADTALPQHLPAGARVVRLDQPTAHVFVGLRGDEADYRASIALALAD